MLAITNLLASQPIASGVGCNEPIGKSSKVSKYNSYKKSVIYIIELKIEQERKL